MRKTTKLLAVLALAGASVFAFASCGTAPKTLNAVYQTEHIATLAPGAENGDGGDNFQTLYNVKLFSDNTYQLQFCYTFGVYNFPFNYGRNVTSYGTYSIVSSDEDTGESVIKLEMPTAVELVATHRQQTKIVINSQNWANVDADEDGEVDPVSYVLMERANPEEWTSAADFVASYGRAYTLTVTSIGEIKEIKIDSHNGEQIVMGNAVENVNAKAE